MSSNLYAILLGLTFVVLVDAVPDLKNPRNLHQFIKNPGYLPKNALNRIIKAKQEDFFEGIKDNVCENNKCFTTLKDKATRNENENNSTCLGVLLKASVALYLGIDYALEFDDSHGREESGMRRGNFRWLGNYYQCFGATNKRDFTGQMCSFIFTDSPDADDGFVTGACVADICTEEELENIYQPLLLTDDNTTYLIVRCPDRNPPWDAVDIVCLVILSLLGLFAVIGTILESVETLQKRSSSETGVTPEISSNKSILWRSFSSFSIIKNTNVLFDTTQKEGNIKCLNGIRFISMSWVILGHTYLFTLGLTDNTVDLAEQYVTKWTFQVIVQGVLAVDTFFFLSGLLVAYLGMREMRKRSGKLNVPLMYLSRYLRLTPALALTMLFYVSLNVRIGDGPLWQLYGEDHVPACQKYWWTNLLYINNLYPANMEDDCMGWVWYLANDMQFYLLSPILLYLFYKYPKAGFGVVAFLVLANAAIVGNLSHYYKIFPDPINYAYLMWFFLFDSTSSSTSEATLYNVTEMETTTAIPDVAEDPYWNDLYSKPWCRIGVYMIGMATGYIIYTTKGKIKMNKILALIIWIAVAAVELAIVYGFWGDIVNVSAPSLSLGAFYNAVYRTVWALGLVWVTIACVTGYGGPVDTFLSWRVFIPLSRLTYCAYLVHPIILVYMYISREYELHFENSIMIYYFLAAMILSYGFGYVLSMLIEAPMGNLQKIMFPRRKSPEPEKMRDEVMESSELSLKNVNGDVKAVVQNEYATVGQFGVENKVIQDEITEIDRL